MGGFEEVGSAGKHVFLIRSGSSGMSNDLQKAKTLGLNRVMTTLSHLSIRFAARNL